MPSAKKRKRNNLQKKTNRSGTLVGNLLVRIGVTFSVSALLIIGMILLPVVWNELSYQFRSHKPVRVALVATPTNNTVDVVIPKDKNADIIIPKIRANAFVVWDVDPYDAKIYQQALTKGVAHAKGSVLPGQTGTVFLFSHSSQDFLTANRYNSIFYLLTKLEAGDEIYLFYKGIPFVYQVTGHTIVEPSAVSLLTQKSEKKELALMTCWPPGTTLKRYIVTAQEK